MVFAPPSNAGPPGRSGVKCASCGEACFQCTSVSPGSCYVRPCTECSACTGRCPPRTFWSGRGATSRVHNEGEGDAEGEFWRPMGGELRYVIGLRNRPHPDECKKRVRYAWYPDFGHKVARVDNLSRRDSPSSSGPSLSLGRPKTVSETKSHRGHGESAKIASRKNDTHIVGEIPVNGVFSLSPLHLSHRPAALPAEAAVQATSTPTLGHLEHPSSATSAGGVTYAAASVLLQQGHFVDLDLQPVLTDDVLDCLLPVQGQDGELKWDNADKFTNTVPGSTMQPLEGDNAFRPSCASLQPACPLAVAMFVDSKAIWEVAQIAHAHGLCARLAQAADWELVERSVRAWDTIR